MDIVLYFLHENNLPEYNSNVQKGIGGMMRGALLETSARTILNQGIQQGISQGIQQGISQGIQQGISQGIQQGISQGKSLGIGEAKTQTALKLLKRGKLTIEEIAEDTGLSIEEVEQLAGLHTV